MAGVRLGSRRITSSAFDHGGPIAISLLSLVVVVLVGACSDGSADEAGARDGVVEIVDGANAEPAGPEQVVWGQTLEVRFLGGDERGVGWFMTGRDEGGWADEASYALVAGSDQYDCSDCPHWFDIADGDWSWGDVALDGVGPDLLVIPEEAEPGAYRVCQADEPDPCFEVTVVAGSDALSSWLGDLLG